MAKNMNSPLRRIREYCLSCAGSVKEVKLCQLEDCPLHPMRLGRNSLAKKRELTEEQKRAAAERFAKARERKKAENAQ